MLTSTLLERAGRLATSGRTARAIVVLTAVIRLSPKLWQAYQYRGELHLREGNPAAAADDFAEAIRLAPEELHLYLLRDRANNEMEAERRS